MLQGKAGDTMIIKDFQVNHMSRPVGIDGHGLRLTWKLGDGKKQSAFTIKVTDETGNILEEADIKGDRMFYVLREDIPERTKAKVTLIVRDERGVESLPASIAVVTGIEKTKWKADWILPELSEEKTDSRRASYAGKVFELSNDQIAEAEEKGAYLYATCHGIMNIYINGQEITDRQFMPGTQQYDKRLMVETLDIQRFLRVGENEILVSLGDGWYRGSMGMDQEKNIYGTDLALLLQLEIGKKTVVKTDETWMATQDGPIGRNDFMAGEEYDARKEFTGKSEGCMACFHGVKKKNFGFDNLIYTDTVPIIPHEIFQAEEIITPDGDKVLDFGQNLVGYVSFEFEGTAGQKLSLIHGETLDLNGNFTTVNFQNPKKPVKQQIDYICRDGKNKYHPTKTYMGFRYVKVIADFEIDPADFKAVALYSDIKVTASFACGVPEVEKLFENALWSMKGNFIDVPTDCPTREKSGYSGDCQVYVHTAMYLMDCYCVYAKWLREQAAGQYEDGVVPQIAPKDSAPGVKQKMGPMMSLDGGIGWSDAFEIVPYRLMKRYGDDTLIREYYEALRRWTQYEIRRAEKTRWSNRRLLTKEHRKYMIDTGWMWGEWLEPGQDTVSYMSNLVMNGDPETGTAFFYTNLRYMEEFAKLLGKHEDRQYYRNLAEKARDAYRAFFLEDGRITEKKRQCRFVRPIAHDLLTESEKVRAAADLARLVDENNNHLNTGFLTTHELNRSLSRFGQNRKAYDLLLQKEKPGWLYSVMKGCTTIPESWDCFDENGTPSDPFNHYSYGTIAGWLMDCVCGINVEEGKIRIQPYPDPCLGYAKAVYDSPYGTIISGWEYRQDKIVYHIEIPANMMAEILIEGLEKRTVDTGIYDLEICLSGSNG